MKALIIANSPDFDTAYIERHSAACDLVVVLDGALEKLPASVAPSIICGDFDSIDIDSAKKRCPAADIVHLSNQHANDLEKGLSLVLERGANEVVIACALGGNPAVSLANTAVMIRHHHVCDISIVHGSTTFRVLSDRLGAQSEAHLSVKQGSDFACIAIEGDAVVTLRGVAWELREAILRPGSHGVGNTTTSEEVVVSVHRGLVMVCYQTNG